MADPNENVDESMNASEIESGADTKPASRDDIIAAAGVDLNSPITDREVANEEARQARDEARATAPIAPPTKSVVELQALAMRHQIASIGTMARLLASMDEFKGVSILLECMAQLSDANCAQCDAFIVSAGVLSARMAESKPAPPTRPPTFGRK